MTTIAHDVLDRMETHPDGDCRCSPQHIHQAMVWGYSLCRRCGKLRSIKGEPEPMPDHFEQLRRKKNRTGGRETNRPDAVRYLRYWLTRAERLWLRRDDIGSDEPLWLLDVSLEKLGTRAVRALREARYHESMLDLGPGRTLEEGVGRLLAEAAEKEMDS